MLELVRARGLDRARVVIDFAAGGLTLQLPHVREPDWTIGAMIAPDHAVIDVGGTNEHFGSDEGGRPWPLRAVDFIAEILRGEIEIQTDYRGTRGVV